MQTSMNEMKKQLADKFPKHKMLFTQISMVLREQKQ